MAAFKKIFSISLRIAVSLVIIVFLFRSIDHQNFLKLIRDSDKVILFISFLVFLLPYILGVLRWNMLLKAVNINLPLTRLVSSFCAGLFFNLFLPSTIGGDFMRGADLSFHTKKPKEIIATLFLDRLSGYIGLVILAIFAMFFGWRFLRDQSVMLSLAIILGILVAALFILFNRFLYNKIKIIFKAQRFGNLGDLITSLHEEVHIFRYKKAVIAKNILLSIVIQAIIPVSFYIIALALRINLSMLYFFIFLPIITAIALLPISIGGLGLRDATVVFFFAKAGLAKDLALAMSLLNFSFILIIGALGGLIYVLTVHNRRMQCNSSP